MYYITVHQPERHHQLTLEELIFGYDKDTTALTNDKTATTTYCVEKISDKFKNGSRPYGLIRDLKKFNEEFENLRNIPRKELYYSFKIPKKSGGLRQIDAPNDDLKLALTTLKELFETKFHARYHTSAYAYVKGRSVVDCMKKHQSNESKWFAKYDLTNFFGSNTLDFVIESLSHIFPFSEVIGIPEGKEELTKAIELAFLNDGLPQGTPISPLITNIIMIPIDFTLANKLRNFDDGSGKEQHYIYTRYADDFQVSCRYTFNYRAVERLIVETLNEFNAPFKLNNEKTRYGSSAGRNWNLGIMLNKDNKLTVGHRKKRQLQCMLHSYAMDKKSGKNWSLNDVQVMDGIRSYYKMVEGDSIDGIVEHLSKKLNMDIMSSIKEDLRNL